MATEKFTLRDLVTGLAARSNIEPNLAEEFVKAFTDTIMEGLHRDMMVKIKGLGTFKLVTVESRESINVNTGERFMIEGHSKVAFTPDPVLRDAINKPFADFQTVALHDNLDVTGTGLPTPTEEEPVVETDQTSEFETSASELEAAPIAEDFDTVSEESAIQNDALAVQNEVSTVQSDALATQNNTKATQNDKEPEPIPTIEPAEEPSTVETPKRVWPKLLLGIIVLALCSLFYLAGYYRWCLPVETDDVEVLPTIVEEQPAAEIVKATEEVVEVAPRDTVQYPQVKNGAYRIVGVKDTCELERGRSLCDISIKYYGNKDFVPYIVALNKIPNPDIVHIGTQLLIPELEEVEQ